MLLLGALLFGCRGGDGVGEEDQQRRALAPMGVVIPLTEARRLLTACDGTRVIADSLWTPPQAILRAAEKRLAEHLSRLSQHALGEDPLETYSRQYFGISRGARTFILINGVHQQYLHHTVQRDTTTEVPVSVRIARAAQQFRTRAVQVCDGGRAFFRAEYDVEGDTISSFAFNGLN